MVPEDAVRFYLCPERKISFDGFVNYEGRRFGVPYSYPGATARVERSGDLLRIYSADLKVLLVTHTVTWSRTDSFCEGQYESLAQPEEFPTAPVRHLNSGTDSRQPDVLERPIPVSMALCAPLA